MTHEELVTRVAIAMRTKREAILERPLSRCWEELARVAVGVAVDECAQIAANSYADTVPDILALKGEPA